MKVLIHEGVVLTLPFTTTNLPGSDFDRLDGQGVASVGVVAERDQAAVQRAVRQAAALEQSYATPQQITSDMRFIARALSDVADGTEIRLESRGTKIRLVIPDDARPKRDDLKPGDRVAINSHVSPKAWLNTHGTVERITGTTATIKLDEGDRQRVTAATGRDMPESMRAQFGLLDKLAEEK